MSLVFVSHSLYSTWPVLPQVFSGASARIDAKNRTQGASFLISVGSLVVFLIHKTSGLFLMQANMNTSRSCGKI